MEDDNDQDKRQWFPDAYNFLMHLPRQTHIWCGCPEIMGPFLETFYHYFEDESHNSPLKLLWNRISEEMQTCTCCICRHHEAQMIFNLEYLPSKVGPLISVLRSLDEERVTKHLKEMNARIERGEYDPVRDSNEVISLMFEVLMFPILLDDLLLATEFQAFIDAIDNSHELTLAGDQQYPVITYVLRLHKFVVGFKNNYLFTYNLTYFRVFMHCFSLKVEELALSVFAWLVIWVK